MFGEFSPAELNHANDLVQGNTLMFLGMRDNNAIVVWKVSQTPALAAGACVNADKNGKKGWELNMEKRNAKFSEDNQLNVITKKIIGCAFKVGDSLGNGFLEKVYENAVSHELRKIGLKVDQEYAFKVIYDGVVVGNYLADLLVEDCVLVELKTVQILDNIHLAQCMNYLRATGLEICLLINFYRPKVEVRRIVNHFSEAANPHPATNSL